ncbi:hypothetical protein Tco_0967415 [Tanacetum coccineum]
MVAYLKKPIGSKGFQEIVDFLNGSHIRYALTKNPTIYVSLIKKFWQTATVRTVDNGEQEITAIVDGKEFTLTEASVMRHLQLADADEEGEGSGHPSEPQPPPSTAQPTNEEPILNVVSSLYQKTQTPRQALNKVTELPQTNEPILNVTDEAVFLAFEKSKTAQDLLITRLKLRVKKMEKKRKRARTLQPMKRRLFKVRVKSSTDENLDEEDLSKQGKSMIEEIDQDAGVTLVQINAEDQGRFNDETDFDAGFYKVQVTPTQDSAQGEAHSQEDQPEDHLGVLSAAKVLADAARKNVHTYTRRRRAVSTGSGGISTASRLFSTAEESVSTAGASMPVSTAGMVQEVNISIPSPVVVKDKGKGKMEESEDEQTKRTKLQQEQDRLGYEAAEEWENIRARVEADEELTQRLQAEERNKYSEVDQAKMLIDLINQRKKYFVAQKAEAKRNKPLTQAQQRNYMNNYIKHMGSHTLQQLRGYSYDEIKELFKTTIKRGNTFVPMETKVRGRASELAAGSSQETITDCVEVGSSKRATEAELDHEGSKRQKTNEASGSIQEQPDEEEKELSQEDLQQMMMVVPGEEVYVETLQIKYQSLTGRDDLVMLWSLVKERFSSTEPTDDKERTLWVELKRLFEPDTDDTLWKLQRYMHDPLTWRLYDTCGVHHVSTEKGMDIFMLVEKEYPLSKGILMLMLVNKLLVDQHSEMANELLRKIFIQANRPRL